MSHYEKRLENELELILGEIHGAASRAEVALRDSVRALIEQDRDLASETILKDQIINREIKQISRLCHGFIVKFLPNTRHLRVISSVLRITVAVERIGDYAVTICRESLRLEKSPPELVRHDLKLYLAETQQALGQAIKAFDESDLELAARTQKMVSKWARTFDEGFKHLTSIGEKGSEPVKDLFSLLIVFNRLSRVCDQAQNICEDTIFSLTGESIKPKFYRVLFVDEKNECGSQMAEAIARKAFSEYAEISSAGLNPAPGLSPHFLSFMEDHGHDLRGAKPRELVLSEDTLSDYHIIVGLDEGLRTQLNAIPHHVLDFEWRLQDCPPESWEHQDIRARYEENYRTLADKVSGMFETLVGDVAD